MENKAVVSSPLRKKATLAHSNHVTTQRGSTDLGVPARPHVDPTPPSVAATDTDDEWADTVVAALLRSMAIVWVTFLLLLSMSLYAGSEKRHDLAPMLTAAVATFALQTGDINGWIGLSIFPSLIVETIKVIIVAAVGEEHEATASFVLQFLVVIYVFSAGPSERPTRSPADLSVLIVRAVTFFGLPMVVCLHFLQSG